MGQDLSALAERYTVDQQDIELVLRYAPYITMGHGALGPEIFLKLFNHFPEEKRYFLIRTPDELERDPTVIIHGLRFIYKMARVFDSVKNYDMAMQHMRMIAEHHRHLDLTMRTLVNLRACILDVLSRRFGFTVTVQNAWRRVLSAIFQIIYNFNVDRRQLLLTREVNMILKMSQDRIQPVVIKNQQNVSGYAYGKFGGTITSDRIPMNERFIYVKDQNRIHTAGSLYDSGLPVASPASETDFGMYSDFSTTAGLTSLMVLTTPAHQRQKSSVRRTSSSLVIKLKKRKAKEETRKVYIHRDSDTINDWQNRNMEEYEEMHWRPTRDLPDLYDMTDKTPDSN